MQWKMECYENKREKTPIQKPPDCIDIDLINPFFFFVTSHVFIPPVHVRFIETEANLKKTGETLKLRN